MSDFKNAFDSYKKISGKKTENSGFSEEKDISSKKTKNRSIKTGNLPEHLKKSLSENNSSEGNVRGKTALNNNLKETPVSPEKFVFHELDKSSRNSGYFIKETEEDKTVSDSVLKNNKKKKYTESGLKRVAKLLALLGKDEAANVLKKFFTF